MTFFKKKSKAELHTQETRQEKELGQLRMTKKADQIRSEEILKMKQDKKELKALRREVHPSKFQSFSKALGTVSKGVYKGSALAYKDAKIIHAKLKEEKKHARKTRHHKSHPVTRLAHKRYAAANERRKLGEAI
jgi:hypothetical protein